MSTTGVGLLLLLCIASAWIAFDALDLLNAVTMQEIWALGILLLWAIDAILDKIGIL